MSASRINPTLISKAAEVIKAAMAEGNQEAYSLAFSLDCAQLLQSPETAAELVSLRARVAKLEAERHTTNEALSDAAEALRTSRDRIAELERPHRRATDGELAEQRHLVDPLDHALEALAPRTVPAQCRCDEPGADPYACEAEPDDCSGHFSELNPHGSGARPVDVASADVSRTCETCGWRTSVWHVADGSAEAELHEHVTRVHGGRDLPTTTIEISGSAL